MCGWSSSCYPVVSLTFFAINQAVCKSKMGELRSIGGLSEWGLSMKKLVHLFLSVVSAAALLSTEASASVINGTVNLTLTGTLRVPGTGYTKVDCKAFAVLIPTTDATVSLGAAGVLAWLYSADQSANAHAGFATQFGGYSTAGSSVTGNPPSSTNAGTVTAFTCSVHVPYTFTDAVGGQSVAVMYEVSASDSGGPIGNTLSPPTYPGGHTRQVMQIALPPANGGVINLSAHLKL